MFIASLPGLDQDPKTAEADHDDAPRLTQICGVVKQ
jgi:hypothetical protein